MLLIDPAAGTILAANPAALRFYGYPREVLCGMHISALDEAPAGTLRKPVDCGARSKRLHRLRCGKIRWVEVCTTTLRHDDQALLCAIITDITEYQHADAALLAAKERLQVAIESARLVVWDASVDEGMVYLSEGWAQLRGETPRPVRIAGADYIKLVHPDDRDLVNRAVRDSIKGGCDDYDQEYRLHNLEGRWIWLQSRGRVSERGADGRARRMSGTLMDVTARKLAEERLMESEQRFRDVVDAAGEYVWESDPQFRLTYVSDRVESMLGYTPQEVLGHRPSDFLHVGESLHSQSWYKTNASPDGTFRGLEQCVVAKSGRLVWQRITGIPVRNAQGVLTGYRGTALDITEAREAHERLERLATRDSLTGLPNRALLADRTARAILAAQRSGEQCALLFIDLDNFKQVNDTHGHHVGDLLLKQVALRLSEAVRRADTIARLGGDEFVVLLTSLKETGPVASVAAKICTELARPVELPDLEGQVLRTSGSVGVSVHPGDGTDFTTLMKKADTAMYRAKARGRNTYEIFAAPADGASCP